MKHTKHNLFPSAALPKRAVVESQKCREQPCTLAGSALRDWNEIRVAFKNYNLVGSYELRQQVAARVETLLTSPLVQRWKY